MKSKVISFITTVIMLIIIFVLLGFLGLIFFEIFLDEGIVEDVETFVSNGIIIENDVDTVDTENIISVTVNEEIENKYIQDVANGKNRFFYQQLDEESKVIYNALENNKENMKTGTYEVNLGDSFASVLSREDGSKLLGEYFQSAIEAYTYDNPDVFYIDFSKLSLNIETTKKVFKTTYRVFLNSGKSSNYLEDEFSSKQQIDSVVDKLERVRAYFIQNKSKDVYSNLKLVHDYLVGSIEYDETLNNPGIYSIYGALVNKSCVCEGYAEAYKYILDALDIPCVIVSGVATNSNGKTELHAWNYVEIDGVWYAVDCTWDDPIIIGGGLLTNSMKYKYFLKGQISFNKNHVPDGRFTEEGRVFQYPNLSVRDY